MLPYMKLKNSRQSELFIRPQTEFFFSSNMLITTAEAKKCEHYRTLKHGVLIYFFSSIEHSLYIHWCRGLFYLLRYEEHPIRGIPALATHYKKEKGLRISIDDHFLYVKKSSASRKRLVCWLDFNGRRC